MLPRPRLAKSSGPRDISQRLIPEGFENGRAHQKPLVALAGKNLSVFQTLKLHHKTRDVDAIANRVGLVGGMRLLQKLSHIIEDLLFAERHVFLENRVLFVALG